MKKLAPFAIAVAAATLVGCAPDPVDDVPDVTSAAMEADSEGLWAYYAELERDAVYDTEHGCAEVVEVPMEGDREDLVLAAHPQGCVKHADVILTWRFPEKGDEDEGGVVYGSFEEAEDSRSMRGFFHDHPMGVLFSSASTAGGQIHIHGMVVMPEEESEEGPYFKGMFEMR